MCAEYAPRNPIAEYWRGQISLRHLRVLIEHLPPTSAYHRHVSGHAWSDVEYLLAVLGDRLAENTYVTAKAGGMKGARKPKPLPRPGETDKNRTGDRGDRSTVDVVTYLDQFNPSRSA